MRHRAAWVLALVAVLPYLEARNFGHVHDDHDLRGPGSLAADARVGPELLWRADLFGSAERPFEQSGFWRPLIAFSYRLEHLLTAGEPVALAWLGHCVSILLHVLASLALWRLARELALPDPAAALAAALFALHPLHAESVAWISGRTDVAATALAWWGTLALLPASAGRGRVALGVAAMSAALLCKESALLLLGLCALLRWVRGRHLARASAPLALALGLVLLLRWASFERGLAPEAYTGPASAGARWYTWLSILPDLMRMTLWPGPASPVHPVSEALTLSAPGVLPGLLLLGLLLFLALRETRAQRPLPLLSLSLWAGTGLLLAPWVRFPTGFPEVAAPLYERNLYAAAAAPCLLVGWLVARRGLAPAKVWAGVLLASIVLVPVTLGRSRVWSSDQAFALAALERAPASPNLWNHLGVARLSSALDRSDAGAGEQALLAFERALAFDPGHAHARLNRFLALASLGREEDAAAAAEQLLASRPDDPGVLDNLAAWHARAGRYSRAVQLYRRELDTGTALPGAQAALAACLRAARAAAAPLPLDPPAAQEDGAEGGI